MGWEGGGWVEEGEEEEEFGWEAHCRGGGRMRSVANYVEVCCCCLSLSHGGCNEAQMQR